MRHYNPLNRFGRLLVLGAVVAGVTASAAVAIPVVDPQDTGTANLAAPVSRPPDVQDAMTARHAAAARLKADSGALPTAAGLKADGLRWQGIAQVYQQKQAVPDVVERYAATHSGGGRLVVPESLAPRPPDVSDAALAARYGSTATGQSSGFDWNDWAIGIGTGIGLALLLGAAFLMGRQLRHPVQTA
jgi:hypothetical protein